MKSFKDLYIWQRSMELVKRVYEITEQFPDIEKYGLVTQIRRSAVSIPSNIAEGHTRQTKKEFKQFVAIARGSCAELQTQIILSRELNYIDQKTFDSLQSNIEILAKMLSSFYGKL